MRKITLLFLFILLGISKNYAQDSDPVTTAAPFLRIAPDARSGGLADMGVATTADANSQFFNPAKYAFSNAQYALGINYTPWLRNISSDVFLGSIVFSNRINERSAWGASMRYFSYGDIELSDSSGFSTGTESPSDLAIDGSYSLKLNDNISMGVAMRYIRSDFAIKSQNSDLKTVNTFAVDLASYYQSDEQNYGNFNGVWRAGVNISNMGPKVKYTESGEKNNIPTNLGMGGGFDFILDEVNTIAANLEVNQLLVSDIDFAEFAWAFSSEYNYNNTLAVRAGYYSETEQAGNREFFTLGAGFRFKSSIIDLSYLINSEDVNNPLENTLRFSVSFDFGEIYNDIFVKSAAATENSAE